ncbi:MAG: hypothetical protein MRY59_07530 [Aquisalinus sp.]|nr:hypothetical protein [Aquisalinus sp.]
MSETILLAVGIYCLAGIVISLLFLVFGIARADHAAKGAGLVFRLTILPGLIFLWPIILGRWLSGRQINQDIHGGDNS